MLNLDVLSEEENADILTVVMHGKNVNAIRLIKDYLNSNWDVEEYVDLETARNVFIQEFPGIPLNRGGEKNGSEVGQKRT